MKKEQPGNINSIDLRSMGKGPRTIDRRTFTGWVTKIGVGTAIAGVAASCGKDSLPDPIDTTKPNTLTVSNYPPTNISGKSGDIVIVKKITATDLQGKEADVYLNEDYDKTVIEVEDQGTEFKITFKAAGKTSLTQTAQSEIYDEKKDTNGDGVTDTITYLPQTKDVSTEAESLPVDLGYNSEGVAEVQEKFNEKITQGQSITIMGADIINFPSGYDFETSRPIITIFPLGAVEYTWLYDNNNRTSGAEFHMNYDYRGDDIKIQFKIQDGSDGEKLYQNITIPRGVYIDATDPEQVRTDAIEHFRDLFMRGESGGDTAMIEKWDIVTPKIYLENAPDGVAPRFAKAIDDFNSVFTEAGSTTNDGSPFQIEIVTNPEDANLISFFGTKEDFDEKFDTNITTTLGGMLRLFTNDDNRDGHIIAGATYVKYDGSDLSGESDEQLFTNTALQELMHVLGMSGEVNEKKSSLSSEWGHTNILSRLDKVALQMHYDNKLKVGITTTVATDDVVSSLADKYVPPMIERNNA